MNRAGKSRRIAFGGIVAGLSLAVLLFAGLFPFLEYACPAAAGILLVMLVLDFNKKTALIAYAAVALLALLICPNKEAAVLFACFFGCYPILKSCFEQLRSRILEWVLKLVFFNVSVLAGYWIVINLFGLTEVLESIRIAGFEFSLQISMLLLLLAGNVAFFLYDFALTRLIVLFCSSIQPKLRKIIP